ncbi:MAG: PAS domain-containing protein [Phormidium tanganyikae FI6-MK23]|jgi:PAS domain S-box-containing protein|nr:PAS domain-containing protein [Phormidium tanganyikae FI6-MK23]
MLDCFGIYSAIRDESGQIIDFRFDYLNAAAMESNEMTPADLSKRLCEVFPAHHTAGLLEDYCRVVETGEPLSKENLVYSDVFGAQHLTRAYDIRANKLDDGFVASWRDVTARKQAEVALQEANQRITTIWESMTDAYVTLDRKWRITCTNSAATEVVRQLANLEPAEFLGQSYWEVFPSVVGTMLDREFRRAIAEQIPVHFELLYNPSGNWFEIHAYPSQAGLGIYFRDISDRKRIEAERQRAEETIQQKLAEIEVIYNTAPIGLCFLDRELRFVRMNEQLAEINGLSIVEQIGHTVQEVLPELGEIQAPLFQQVMESGVPILDLEVEGTTPAHPGIQRHWLVSYYPLKALDRQVLGINIMVQEITERKQTEAALRESERRFRAVFDQTFELMGMISLEGILLDANQAALDSIAAQSIDIIGKPFWEAPWWTHSEFLQDQLKDAIAQATTGEFIRYEVQFPSATGEIMTTDFSLKPVFDEAGQVVMLVAEARDISDRKAAEAERVQLLREAEAANRSKDEFVAMVAHELRSPLNSIAGWSKLLQTRKFDEATVAKALDTIYRNTQTQVQLVEDLLDISRMVKGTLQIHSTPLNLVDVVRASLEIIRPAAEAKQIQLEAQLSLTAQLSGDINRLQQIVINLLTNAIKFTEGAGRVEVSLMQIDDQVELRIQDSGKGIAAEVLPFIFERFKQGQQNTGSKDGLGLGLAIVKKLVELHNGTIAAESLGVGQSATFIVRFPVLKAIDLTISSDDARTINQAALAGVRIFVVDDELDMLDLITFFLEEYGAEVRSASSAAATLERLPEFKPDILISDIAMPNGNGYELLEQLKARSDRDIPAIALTAYSSATYEERSLQAGFQQHLTKPVEPEVLVAAIISLVRERK